MCSQKGLENVNIFAITSSIEYKDRLINLGVKEVLLFNDICENDIVDKFPSTKFDIVFDPFMDVYFNKSIKFVNFNGKYIHCGFYKQNILYPSLITNGSKETYFNSLAECMIKNISVIGNCLGVTNDLLAALKDFYCNDYSPIIYKKYGKSQLIPFLETSFHKKNRFGKVVFSYD